MVTRIGRFEAKTNFGKFAKRAAGGEIIESTDLGKPLARLVSASARDSGRETLQLAFERFKQLRENAVLNPPGLSEVTVKELVEEGRKW